MNAFLFKPSNELLAKLPIGHINQLETELKTFIDIGGPLPDHSYVEALGHTWTIVSQSPLRLQEGRVSPPQAASPALRKLPAVTTDTFPGHIITGTCGIVTGEAIMGNNILRDLAATARDIVGGRSAAYENNLRKGRSIALAEMNQEAYEAGGHAIVGVRFDYETSGAGMFIICVSGTAVTVQKAHPSVS